MERARALWGRCEDFVEAEKYLRIGSDGGDISAQRNLGFLLLQLERPGEAALELSKAAEAGDEQAVEVLAQLAKEAEAMSGVRGPVRLGLRHLGNSGARLAAGSKLRCCVRLRARLRPCAARAPPCAMSSVVAQRMGAAAAPRLLSLLAAVTTATGVGASRRTAAAAAGVADALF